LKVPALGADTEKVRAELEGQDFFSNRQNRCEARMNQVQDVYPGRSGELREVGLRDGLQLVKTFPSPRRATLACVTNMAPASGISEAAFVPGRQRTFPNSPTSAISSNTVASLPGRRHRAGLNERGVNEAPGVSARLIR